MMVLFSVGFLILQYLGNCSPRLSRQGDQCALLWWLQKLKKTQVLRQILRLIHRWIWPIPHHLRHPDQKKANISDVWFAGGGGGQVDLFSWQRCPDPNDTIVGFTKFLGQLECWGIARKLSELDLQVSHEKNPYVPFFGLLRDYYEPPIWIIPVKLEHFPK